MRGASPYPQEWWNGLRKGQRAWRKEHRADRETRRQGEREENAKLRAKRSALCPLRLALCVLWSSACPTPASALVKRIFLLFSTCSARWTARTRGFMAAWGWAFILSRSLPICSAEPWQWKANPARGLPLAYGSPSNIRRLDWSGLRADVQTSVSPEGSETERQRKIAVKRSGISR